MRHTPTFIILITLFASCSEPTLPASVQSIEKDERLVKAMKKLSADDQKVFADYLVRISSENRYIPSGTTIQKAIDEQRSLPPAPSKPRGSDERTTTTSVTTSMTVTQNQPLIVTKDYDISSLHQGTVDVQSGHLMVSGTLQGTLSVASNAKASILGMQQGTVAIAPRATVTVRGTLQGTVSVNNGGQLVVEEGGQLKGTLANEGVVVIRGVYAGKQTGGGQLRVEGKGVIKQPRVVDGINYYD